MDWHHRYLQATAAAWLGLSLASCTGSTPKSIQIDKQPNTNGTTGSSGRDGTNGFGDQSGDSADGDSKSSSGSGSRSRTGNGDGSSDNGSGTAGSKKPPGLDSGTGGNAAGAGGNAAGTGGNAAPGSRVDPISTGQTTAASGSNQTLPPPTTLTPEQAKALIGSWDGRSDLIPATVTWTIANASGTNASGTTTNASGTNASGTTINTSGTASNLSGTTSHSSGTTAVNQ